MDRDRARVLLLFTVFLGLIVASLFIQDWFIASTPAGTMSIDLRHAQMCATDGGCMSFSLGELRAGFYGTLGFSTFYGSIIFALLVSYQAITRIASGFANSSLSKIGYFAGLGLCGSAGAAAYLFNPQVTGVQAEMMSMSVDRTLAPLVFFLAMFVGIAVLYYAMNQASDDVGEYKPLAPIAPPTATALPARPKTPTAPPVVAQKHPSQPPASAFGSGPTSVLPEHLRKKMKYVAVTAEITRAGVEARREDGSSKLVMWRDVVGLVARRMPAENDGITFLDVVSTAGSTLRVLPWTRVTGESCDGEGDAWMRALLGKLVGYCGSAALDPATRRFKNGELAAQLPDTAKLSAHDAKLA
jgi:hypothetical protein